jgi:hypothetical protein
MKTHYRQAQSIFGPRATSAAAACLVTAVALAVIYSPALRPDRTFGGMDFLNLIYPQVSLGATVFGQGRLPLWNWYTWGGSPLLAAWQSALFYPPTWLTMTFGLPFGLQIVTLLHLILAGVGAATLARHAFRAHSWGCSLAAVAYAGGGFFLGHVEQVNSIASIAWTPWILDGFWLSLAGRCGMERLAIITALGLLAGHPQHVELAAIFAEVGALTAIVLRVAPSPSAGQNRRLPICGFVRANAAMLVGVLLALPQLLPALEMAAISERIWPYPDPFTPHFRWAHIPAFVVPRFYNHLAGTAGQPLGFTEEAVYCGILAVALSLVFVISLAARGRAWRHLLLWATVTLAALLFALGPETPVAPWLFEAVPPMASLRGTARALNIVTLMTACAAGAGLTFLCRTWLWRWRRAVGPIAVLAVVVDLAWTHRPEIDSLLIPREVLNDAKPLLSGTCPTPDSPQRVYRFMANDSDLYLDHRVTAVAERVYRLQPNINIPWSVALVDGYEEGLLPAWEYGNFLRRFNRNLRNATLDAPLLALMGAGFAVTEYPVSLDPHYWERVSTTAVRPLVGARYTVWRNRCATAWFFDALTLSPELARPANDESWFAWARPGGSPLARKPARESPGQEIRPHPVAGALPERFSRASSAAGVRVRAIAPNGLLLDAENTAPRRVVFAGTLCDGWKLVENGKLLSHVGAGSRLRPFGIIEIPAPSAGSRCPRSLELVYRPASVRYGVFGGLAALCLLIMARLPRMKCISWQLTKRTD